MKAGRRAPAPGSIRGELAALQRRPRKRLGQHFLADPAMAQRIVASARLRADEPVVEIGPGLGALTDRLVGGGRPLWLIELDADLAARLQSRYAAEPTVHVIAADALTVAFADLVGAHVPAVLIGNLPYNVATPILAAALEQRDCFSRIVVMLQREVAERLSAAPGTAPYSALSVLTQFAARVEPAFQVPPAAFVPRPKVESSVVVLHPYPAPPVDAAPGVFRRVVRTAFAQRRKQLANSLRPLIADAAALLRSLNIDPQRRPETLALEEFAAIARAVAARQTHAGAA